MKDPEGVIIGASEELVKGGGISRIHLAVIHEVLAGVLGVITPRVLR